jgi:hypothetical protein
MNHLSDYVALAIAIHGVALAVVNLTPTPKDNEALDSYTKAIVKAYRAIEILAGIISPRVKR